MAGELAANSAVSIDANAVVTLGGWRSTGTYGTAPFACDLPVGVFYAIYIKSLVLKK